MRSRAQKYKDVVSVTVGVLLLTGLGAGLIAIEYWAPVPTAGVPLEGGQLRPAQEKALDLTVDLVRLFMTWSIAVIGAIGYFLQLHNGTSPGLANAQLVLAELVILISVVSIFFGHLAITSLAETLAYEVLEFTDGPHVLYETLQYLLFLGALIAFGVFIHLTYWFDRRE